MILMSIQNVSDRRGVILRLMSYAIDRVRIGRCANAPTIDAYHHMDAVDDPGFSNPKKIIPRSNSATTLSSSHSAVHDAPCGLSVL